MLLSVLYAVGLVFVTTTIHALCTALVLGWLRSANEHNWLFRNTVTGTLALASVVFLMSLAAFAESAVWGAFYWQMGVFPTLGDATYFSLVTFTTLGYGDVTIEGSWRMLGAFEAANGIIMFGWTTAIIVALAHRLFIHSRASDSQDPAPESLER